MRPFCCTHVTTHGLAAADVSLYKTASRGYHDRSPITLHSRRPTPQRQSQRALIKCATELITYTTTDYGGSVITTLLAPSPAPSSKSTGTGVRSTHKRCVSLSDMKRQRPSAAEAARASSQLRQHRHVHNISGKAWDAQARRWSLAGRICDLTRRSRWAARRVR